VSSDILAAALEPLSEDRLQALLERARRGDRQAAEEIVRSHIKLVWSIVQRFRVTDREMTDDLLQAGCMGLMKAIRGYDPSFQTKFSTYAVPTILGEIRKCWRTAYGVKVSRRAREIAREARLRAEEVRKATGRNPKLKELAHELRVPEDELIVALEATRGPVSLYEVVHEKDGDEKLLIDSLPADVTGSWFDALAVREAIASLDETLREVIIARYVAGKTQAEVAASMGLSQAHVSRLESKAVKRMREYLSD